VVQQAQARIGATLKDKWTLDHLFGVGGMASVYAATHRNQKRVAIKMLHPELSHNAAIRQRFLREGYIGNSVQHPGAVSVFDDDVSEDGCAFLVMELLDGETLEGRWERKGKRLPAAEVLALMDRVLDTLHVAHERGIVHRDLKPENLFFTRDALVKVLDFGIAGVREMKGTSKTQTGTLMGTPAFMPPEQARGRWEEVDAQSDLWAVGATMFTLLSGQLVHVASTPNESLVMAVTQSARSLKSVCPEMPRSVVELVDRALAYDKAARWTDALAMQAGLRSAYAMLEWGEDQQTVLAEAAAALPPSQSTLVSAGSTTALAASASAPPTTNPMWKRTPVAIGGAAIVLAAGLLVALFHESPNNDAGLRVASSPVAVGPKPSAATLASAPPSPPTPGRGLPTIALDDLPSEKAATPHAAASVAPSRPSPSAAPAPSRAGSSAPTKPKPAPVDPFAGRD
jgi:serine/threonine-protein kinase